jgi:hypothetical protein
MKPSGRITVQWLTVSLLILVLSGIGFARPLQEPANKKPLTNTDILRMIESGLSDELITAAIQVNEVQFDLSSEALILLKKAGVSERIMSAMFAAAYRTNPPPAGAPAAPMPVQVMAASVPQQPYALYVEGEEKRNLLRAQTQLAQADVKGTDLASLAVNTTVDGVLLGLASTGAVHAAVGLASATGSALAAAPIIGVAATVIPSLILGRRAPMITYIWALPGHHSSTELTNPSPIFEIFFGEIPGVNPDEFRPLIVRLPQTKNNWRLVGAQREKVNAMQGTFEWKSASYVQEGAVPLRYNQLASGHLQVQPESPLEPGEYALVLRPISSKKKLNGVELLVGQSGEGLVFNSIWDFSVKPASVNP